MDKNKKFKTLRRFAFKKALKRFYEKVHYLSCDEQDSSVYTEVIEFFFTEFLDPVSKEREEMLYHKLSVKDQEIITSYQSLKWKENLFKQEIDSILGIGYVIALVIMMIPAMGLSYFLFTHVLGGFQKNIQLFSLIPSIIMLFSLIRYYTVARWRSFDNSIFEILYEHRVEILNENVN